MSAFKQLHVRVAEALGCQLGYDHNLGWYCHCPQDENGDRPHFRSGDQECISRYDTDWSAAGPLIEKYGFTVGPCAGYGAWYVAYRIRKDGSLALPGESPFDSVFHNDMPDARTPLLAVCNLILTLSESGKLPRG